MSQTLVEKMLPGRLLINIGIYMQSAAHLELAIWQIVMLVEQVDQTSITQLTASLESKKNTPKLHQALRRCSTKCYAPLGLRISSLAGKVEQSLENRNLAAHGAFFFDDAVDSIRVAHYFTRGKKETKQWFEVNEGITDRMIASAISEMDSLLREAVSIRNALEKLQQLSRNHSPLK